LEPLLLSSKEEWKKQRTSIRDHPSTNRATQSATAILSAVKKAREKAASELALQTLKNDKFIASRLNNNPTRARAQDIKQFNTQNQHHLPCPNCEHSSVMAMDTEAEVATKNAEITRTFSEKVCILTCLFFFFLLFHAMNLLLSFFLSFYFYNRCVHGNHKKIELSPGDANTSPKLLHVFVACKTVA
jgi:hypothetical protein